MFKYLSEDQLRAICRNSIEAFEKWARIIVHFVLNKKYGQDFLHVKNADGNYKFKTKLVEKSEKMMQDEPGRFPTILDTLFLEELIYFLSHPDVFSLLAPYLKKSYPEGKEEMKTFLNRLIPIRNKLSHTNPFSYQDAQRAICYSNDFIDSVKYFFEQQNMIKEFNVPSILKVKDSLGNEKLISYEDGDPVQYRLQDPNTKQPKVFYFGDQFSVTLEMDPSFEESKYDIIWVKKEGVEVRDNGKKINVTIGNKLIGETTLITCEVISKEDYHRYGRFDQRLFISFKALPFPPTR